ncbi:hypothetical protein PENSPDRAFT_691422 [Peniophora sp. CONT]|nr:hypothetical protein PENSPDRAFT_691422 [Peniophora sp. CONT]
MNTEPLEDARRRWEQAGADAVLHCLTRNIAQWCLTDEDDVYNQNAKNLIKEEVISWVQRSELDLQLDEGVRWCKILAHAEYQEAVNEQVRSAVLEALDIPRHAPVHDAFETDVRQYSHTMSANALHSLVHSWSPLGTLRWPLDITICQISSFPGEFARCRAAIQDTLVLAIDFEWHPQTKVLLEAGFALFDTRTKAVDNHHLALQGAWLERPLYSSSPFSEPRDFLYGETHEHIDEASLRQGVLVQIQSAQALAKRDNRDLLFAFHDKRQDINILRSRIGVDPEDFTVIDTSNVWCELEYRPDSMRRSLRHAFKWTTGTSGKGWHNAGNDAHAVTVLLEHVLLQYDNIQQARWKILGAHSLCQIPSVDVMRSQSHPAFVVNNPVV